MAGIAAQPVQELAAVALCRPTFYPEPTLLSQQLQAAKPWQECLTKHTSSDT